MYIVIELFIFSLVSASLQKQTIDGISCDCMKSIRCKHWLTTINSGKYLKLPVCGYDSHSLQPLICCPRDDQGWINNTLRSKREVLQGQKNIQLSCTITSENLSPSEIAQQKCKEYGMSVFQKLYEVSIGGSPFRLETFDTCVKPEDLDSEQAQPREYPHAALLGYGNNTIHWKCGGNLISERYILTVAHCVANKFTSDLKWVKLGEFDILTDTDVARPQIYKISKKIVHPDYKDPILYHDIALLKLNKDVTFNMFIRPGCIFAMRDPPEDKANAVGWSYVDDTQESKILTKLELEIVSTDDCKNIFNIRSFRHEIPQGIQEETMICSQETKQRKNPVFNSDSGNSLLSRLSLMFQSKEPYCMHWIIGLTSFGIRHAPNIPRVYTRVSHYVPWIVENVWPDEIH